MLNHLLINFNSTITNFDGNEVEIFNTYDMYLVSYFLINILKIYENEFNIDYVNPSYFYIVLYNFFDGIYEHLVLLNNIRDCFNLNVINPEFLLEVFEDDFFFIKSFIINLFDFDLDPEKNIYSLYCDIMRESIGLEYHYFANLVDSFIYPNPLKEKEMGFYNVIMGVFFNKDCSLEFENGTVSVFLTFAENFIDKDEIKLYSMLDFTIVYSRYFLTYDFFSEIPFLFNIIIIFSIFIFLQNYYKKYSFIKLNLLFYIFLILIICFDYIQILINYFLNIKNLVFKYEVYYTLYELNAYILSFQLFVLFATIIFLIFYFYFFEDSIDFLNLILISVFGMLFLLSSFDLISMFLCVELQSFCLYIICNLKKKNKFTVEAGLKYFILGSLASCFILYGSSLIYGSLGSTNFNDIYLFLNHNLLINDKDFMSFSNITLLMGFFFILIGFFFKLGLAPLHFWLVEVYEGVPLIITSFLAMISKISILFFFIKIIFFVFNFFLSFIEIQNLFYFIGFLSVFIGTFGGLVQYNLKRLIAYSSVNNLGFIFISLIGNNNFNNLIYILFYFIIYIVLVIVFFCIIFCLKNVHTKKFVQNINELANLSNNNFLLALFLKLNLLSILGLPPLAGFFNKFLILQILIFSGNYFVCFLLILLSVISSFYYIRLVKIIFFIKTKKVVFFDYSSINFFIFFILYFFSIINLFFIFFIDGFFDFLVYIVLLSY